MGDDAPVLLVDPERGQRGAHPLELGVGAGGLQDRFMGGVYGFGQCAGGVVAEVVGPVVQDVHGDPAGHIAGRVATHAIGHGRQSPERLLQEGVLVPGTNSAHVGMSGEAECHGVGG